ncbi:MAG: hypothetical protein IT168_09510 [Bryobacterales bacterium]|nr:hypothetical protein [Bryobacterales bacterium]
MLWYKAWRESRARFAIAAAIIAAMCLVYTLFHAQLYPGIAQAHPGVRNYTQYIHWTIFGGATRGILQLSCLLLGLGGLHRDRKQNTLGFTLALPVGRFSLVLSRAAVGTLQVLALSALPLAFVTLGSTAAGQHLPLDYAIRFFPLWAAGGVFTFAISFVASVLFSSEYVALATSYLAYIFYLAATRHPAFSRFHLHVADFMSGVFPHYLDRSTKLWTGAYDLAPIAGFLAAAIALVAFSGFVTSRQDA